MTAVASPGSRDAIAQGCTCPVLDNARGQGSGYRNDDGSPAFWITEGCPLHDASKPPSSGEDAQAHRKGV